MLPVNQAPITSFDSTSSLVSAASDSSAELRSIDSGQSLPSTMDTMAAPAPFADLLTEAVGQVQKLEDQANSSIEGLISGKGVDVHEALIASQEASMGFELVLSLRNKALAAYQQVMGMQF